MQKRIITTDLGLTGFISIVDIDTEKDLFNIIDSFKIEVEEKDLKVLKAGTSKAIVRNQVSFINNYNLIKQHFNQNCFGLFEQITHRPFNSALSGMSLTDTSAVFRSILEIQEIDYLIIPPATWKKFLEVTKDKKTSKDLFDRLVNEKLITIEPTIKTLLKKVKNHNQIESVLIAYFYYLFNKKLK